MKSQGATIPSMQGQMQAMQQYCMALGQQPPPQHLHIAAAPARPPRCVASTFDWWQKKSSPDGVSTARRISWWPMPVAATHPVQDFENWNYCHTHGGDVDNTHTGMTFHHPGLSHNPNAMGTNTMGGNTVGLHRRILPSASGPVPPAPRRL